MLTEKPGEDVITPLTDIKREEINDVRLDAKIGVLTHIFGGCNPGLRPPARSREETFVGICAV